MKTHREVLQATQRLFLDALVSGDRKALKYHIHSSFSYWTDMGELFTGLDNLPILKRDNFSILNIENIETQVLLYDNVAVILSVEHHRGTYLGIDYNNHYRFTRVWKFLSGRWKIITSVASMV